jgi:hypothetical protein
MKFVTDYAILLKTVYVCHVTVFITFAFWLTVDISRDLLCVLFDQPRHRAFQR